MAAAALAAGSPPPRTVPLEPPSPLEIPAGPLGDAVRQGLRIVNDPQVEAKAYVGNGLTCSNCHLDAGRVAFAAPLAGLTGVFPEYRPRRGRVETLEERINDCFERSMNGKPLPAESSEMIGLLAYIAWLSRGVPTGVEVAGRGFPHLEPPAAPDPARGKVLYGDKCAACHGMDGAGVVGALHKYVFPPLWGPGAFNDGAGMARVSVAAAFVQAKMPLGTAGKLTDQQAYDIAAYFTAQPRPAFGGRAKDWPRQDERPADAR
jgi:thiosulfate dehydrogenase